MSNTLLSNQQNNVQTVTLMDTSSAVNSVLSQYGYTLSHGDTERLKSLQPGQTTTVYATGNRYGAILEITRNNDGTYSIRSTTPLNINGQWVDINQTVRSPTATITYSNNNIQYIATTGYSTTGNVYLRESGTPGSTTLATYNVNVSVPITHQITDTEIRFSPGTPQVTTTLQSINVPIITSQQLQNNTNLQPGWYYDPETNQFIRLEYRTIIQPQTLGYSSLPENRLWYGYSSQSINNQTITNQPQILQYSFFNPQVVNEVLSKISNSNTAISNYQTNFNNLGFPSHQNLIAARQTIQNWYTNRYNEYVQTLSNPTSDTNIDINEIIVRDRYNLLRNQFSSQTIYNYNIPTLESYRFASLTNIKNTLPGQTVNYLDKPIAKYATKEYLEESKPGAMLILGTLSLPFALPAISAGISAISAKTSLRLSTPVIKELAKEYAVNTGGFTALNLGINEAYSRLTTGKGLTAEQAKQIIGESVAFAIPFTTFAKGFSLASHPILSTFVKEQTSPTKTILAKSLYDVGGGFVSGTGASFASQGFSKAMGWREDINPYEALAIGSLTGGTTAAIRGFQVLHAAKTGNYGAFATRIIPEKIGDVSLTPISTVVSKDGSIITYYAGKAIGQPQIGQKVLTQKDIPNIKPIEYQFLAMERLEPILPKTEPIGNAFMTTMGYRGEFIAQAGVKRTIGKTEGELMGLFVPTEKISLRDYELWVRANFKDLIKKHPEFIQSKDVPKEGLQLSKQILEGKPIKEIENPNVKTLNIYYPLSELQTGNVDFSKNIAGYVVFRSRGGINLPKGEHYEYVKGGVGLAYYVGGDKNQLAQIATTWGIMRDQYKKGWFGTHQYVSVGSPERGFNVFGYGKAVDPVGVELTLTKTIERTTNIKGVPLKNKQIEQIAEQQLKQLLAYSSERVIPPYYNPKAPPAFGIPSLNIINVNQQLLPNLNNIIRPEFNMEKLKERVTQTMPKLDVVQTMQNIRQRIILPFQELRFGQLQGLQTLQLVDLQKILARERIVTYDVFRSTLTTPYVTTQTQTIRANPPPSVRLTPPASRSGLAPILPPPRFIPFPPLFMPPIVPRIGPSQPSPPIPLGRAKKVELDVVYTFNRLWR